MHLATDWEEYAQVTLELLEQTVGLENLAGDQKFIDNAVEKLRPETKYERRGIELGHRVYDMVFRVAPLGAPVHP